MPSWLCEHAKIQALSPASRPLSSHVSCNRQAFAELYAGQAGELAEKMARLRSKEVAARDSFRSAVERYIPSAVLAALGLAAVPPHCMISVPQPDAGLAAVKPEDLKRAPAPQQVSSLVLLRVKSLGVHSNFDKV